MDAPAQYIRWTEVTLGGNANRYESWAIALARRSRPFEARRLTWIIPHESEPQRSSAEGIQVRLLRDVDPGSHLQNKRAPH